MAWLGVLGRARPIIADLRLLGRMELRIFQEGVTRLGHFPSQAEGKCARISTESSRLFSVDCLQDIELMPISRQWC
jgi:hypothetical protein